jgi:hypothetical protein
MLHEESLTKRLREVPALGHPCTYKLVRDYNNFVIQQNSPLVSFQYETPVRYSIDAFLKYSSTTVGN